MKLGTKTGRFPPGLKLGTKTGRFPPGSTGNFPRAKTKKTPELRDVLLQEEQDKRIAELVERVKRDVATGALWKDDEDDK
jgi:hypothetical protein